jgi:hypothetical protein
VLVQCVAASGQALGFGDVADMLATKRMVGEVITARIRSIAIQFVPAAILQALQAHLRGQTDT